MTKAIFAAVAAAFLFAITSGSALASGDVAKGQKVFKKCRICHTVEAGKRKAQGPNLLGVIGRQAGTTEFKYSKPMIAAGEKGLVWDEENLNEYLVNPKKFLAKFLGEKKVRNKMSFRLKKEDQRENVIAYLKSLSK